MGRKKKKTTKPWCWYCNREFEDEKILLQHQKAKHFKCHICHKKLYTGPGLQIHCMQVHKENIERVPNSIKGRDNISLEICGMDNIPEDDLIEHEKQKAMYSGRGGHGSGGNEDGDGDSDSNDSDSSPKITKQQQPPLPNTPFAKQLPPGTIHGPLPHMAPPLPSNGAPPLPIAPPPTASTSNPLMMMPHHQMMYNPHLAMMNHPIIPSHHPMIGHPMMMPPSMLQQPHSASSQLPPHLMSTTKSNPPPLMGFNATPTGNVASSSSNPLTTQQPPLPPVSSNIKPLFPAALTMLNDDSKTTSNDPNMLAANLPNKVESLGPESKIVHPEDDISLEEYRASHHKYKYIPPQYSAAALPNPLMRTSQQHYAAYHQLYHNGGNNSGGRY